MIFYLVKCFFSCIEHPQFSIAPKNITAYIGEPAWVQCQGKGFPKPQVHYLRGSKEGGNLNETHFVKLPNDTLFIKSLKKEDSGQYFCWLIEQYGSISDTFTITVLGLLFFFSETYFIYYLIWGFLRK